MNGIKNIFLILTVVSTVVSLILIYKMFSNDYANYMVVLIFVLISLTNYNLFRFLKNLINEVDIIRIKLLNSKKEDE